MKRTLFALVALLTAWSACAGTYTLSPGSWQLYKDSANLGSYPTEQDCAVAAAALDLTATYECRTATIVNVTGSVVVAPPPVTIPGGGSFSTSFDGMENPISEGGIWTLGGVAGLYWNNPKTTGGQAVGSVAMTSERYADDIAYLGVDAYPMSANQFAQATVYLADNYSGNGGHHEAELLLRFEITPFNARGYEVLWGIEGYIAIVRWEGPRSQYVVLYDSGVRGDLVPRNGDVLRAEIAGSTISVYRNGALVATATDGKWNGGQPGIGFWPVDGAIPENYGWQDFSAGGL